MQVVHLAAPGDLAAWRQAARTALGNDLAPADVTWTEAVGVMGDLLAASLAVESVTTPALNLRVPRQFLELAETVLCHRSTGRLALLYRLLWRMSHGEPQLLAHRSDSDVVRLCELEKAVRRDSHKMKAFVRFREVQTDAGLAYVAWFEPEHRIVRRIAPFFSRRFAGMHWSILTPDDCVHWSGRELRFSPGIEKPPADEDTLEHLWRVYYAHIFNPARLNVPMMQKEMPQKYWKNLPEARLIPALVQAAKARAGEMIEQPASVPRRRIGTGRKAPTEIGASAPERHGLPQLANALRECRRCPLWQHATQAVPGAGPSNARVMLVGEQPGDLEDLGGEPFRGPAGQLLDRMLVELGIAREQLFLTNAVKHFKFEQRGKVRLHKKASAQEQHLCRPWLLEEIELLDPALIVCLGLTAAAAILGPGLTLRDLRGRRWSLDGGRTAIVTLHPSALLRMPKEDFELAWTGWKEDLREIVRLT